jgi:hypothetical protein
VVHQNREIEKNHQILRVTAGPEIRHFIIRSLIRRGETIVASAKRALWLSSRVPLAHSEDWLEKSIFDCGGVHRN